jgi:hypothetical protein
VNHGRWRALAVSGSLLGVLGCGGDGGSIAIGDLPAAAEDAVCARALRCGQYPDKANCEAVLSFQLQLEADVASGKVIYDGKAAAACLRSYGALGCKISTVFTPPQACRDAFKGTLADGAACLADEECISQSCNTSTCTAATCCPGVCEPQGALGAVCAVGGNCVEGAFCKRDPGAASGVCTALLAAGQPCTTFDECVPGTFCFSGNATTTMTCIAPPAEGQACAGTCDDSADVCHPVSRTCVRRNAVGESCTAATCVSYATCDPATLKCVARVAVGGACSPTTATCITGLSCENGICAAHPDEPACP